MLAAQYNSNPVVITALIKAGADVNARDKIAHTSLMAVATEHSIPAVSENTETL